MAGGGGVYVRGLPGLFYLDLFDEWRSCRPQDKGSCEILQLFFTGFGAFIFVIHHPYVSSGMHSSPVSICNFLLVEPPELMLSAAVGDTTCSPALLPFKSRKKDRKGTLSSVQKFEHAVGQCCFRISPVLAGSIESSGAFWQPSSFASAPQVGFIHKKTSPTREEASP